MAYQVLHLLPEVGYPPARSDRGYLRWDTPQQGYPPARSDGGTQGGVPLAGVPPARSNGGYPRWGIPQQGTPQPGLMGGVPELGYPPPPSWTWLGYPPDWTWLWLWQTKWNYNLPSRTTYAVGKKRFYWKHLEASWNFLEFCQSSNGSVTTTFN